MKRRMKEKDAIVLSGLLGIVILLLTSPLWAPMVWNTVQPQVPQTVSKVAVKIKEEKKTVKEEPKEEEPVNLPIVDEAGVTLGTRINPPTGYKRVEVEPNSFAQFLRDYPLKKSTGVVKLWNGTKREQQDSVQAVFKLPMEKADLQRAAGSVIRMYAEYFWSQASYDKISFRFVNGFQADYKKWQEGFRVRTDATGSIWVNGGSYDASEENYKEYMHTVMTHTSVVSLKEESKTIKKKEIQIGDIFLKEAPGSDVAMVVDVCENERGQKAYLIAKGGTPAQQFHLLTNPSQEDGPWYYLDELKYPLQTSEGEFAKGTLRRLSYLEEDEKVDFQEQTTPTPVPLNQ